MELFGPGSNPGPPVAGPMPSGGIGAVLERARAHDASVGLLRHERVLTTPGDADALIADPLVDAELRAALSAG